MSFLDSALVNNLKAGELPEVNANAKVNIETDSLIKLFGGMFITAVAIIIVARIISKF